MMLRRLAVLTLFASVSHAQDTRPRIEDTPPALSLPPLKELPPPPPSAPKDAPASPAQSPKPAPSTAAQDPTPPPSTIRAQQPAKPAASSTSASGLFVVHGADLKVRTEITRRCEAVAAEVRGLLQDSQEGAIPIVIAIRTAPDLNPNLPAVVPNISQLAHGGFHLQITVQARQDFNPGDLRKELIRMLLVERILRGHQSIDPKGKVLPDWLLIGVHEALDYRSRTRPSALFATVFGTGRVYGIEEILDADVTSLDALSRAVFDTSCCALILTLLEQPDGSLAFRKFLNALPVDDRSNRELLKVWFPGLALTASSLEKWWSLQMANLSRPSVFETLGPAETLEALEKALYFRVSAAPQPPPPVRSSAARSTPKPPVEEPAPEPEKKGLLRGLFSFGDKKEEEEKPAAPKKEEKPVPAPVPAKPAPPEKKPAAEEPKQEGEGGPSLFRRWFGGDKKDSEEVPPVDKKKDAAADLPKAGLHLASPLLALAVEALFADDQGHARPVVSIFGFGKKKTPEEIEAEEKAKAEKAAAKAKEEAARKAEEEAKDAAKKKAAEERAKAREEERAREAAEKAEREAARDKEKAMKDAEEAKKEKPAPEEKKEAVSAAPKPAPEVAEPKPRPKSAPAPATPSTLPLEEFAKVAARKDAKAICAATINNLAALNRRAHPLFRPIIAQYIGVIGAVGEGRTKDVAAALAELKIAREAALKQATDVQAHLDWYEASETKDYTGLFDDYLRLPETIAKELPPRGDVISQHLNELEKVSK